MSYRPNQPLATATTTQPGVIKVDGTTLTVAADATASVVGTAVTALTDISSGSLGGPAASDVDTLNRGGVLPQNAGGKPDDCVGLRRDDGHADVDRQ